MRTTYSWAGRNRDGRKVTGEFVAQSEFEVRAKLGKAGIKVDTIIATGEADASLHNFIAEGSTSAPRVGNRIALLFLALVFWSAALAITWFVPFNVIRCTRVNGSYRCTFSREVLGFAAARDEIAFAGPAQANVDSVSRLVKPAGEQEKLVRINMLTIKTAGRTIATDEASDVQRPLLALSQWRLNRFFEGDDSSITVRIGSSWMTILALLFFLLGTAMFASLLLGFTPWRQRIAERIIRAAQTRRS